MNKKLQKKLGKYASLAGATLVASAANADIIYVDIPDSTFNATVAIDTFDLDIEGDLDFDIRMRLTDFSGSSNYFDVAGAIIASSSTGFYVGILNSGDPIGSSQNFGNNSFAFASYYFPSSVYFGPSANFTDKYLGFKAYIGTDTIFAWLRIDAGASWSSVTVKDYAYNDVVGQSITAGQMPVLAGAATTVVGTDNGDAGDASDLQYSFNMAADESKVGEYRIIAVASASAGSFDVTSARNLPAARYKVEAKTGSNITGSLAAGALDSDGNAIVLGAAYKVFVLSTPAGTATNHELSAGSADVTLERQVLAASNVVGTDATDNYDATDLQITFDIASSEVGIANYEMFIVPSASAGSFDLAAAQGNANGISAPTGANVSYTATTSDLDSDGNAIALGVAYKIFVLSVNNGTGGTMDSLSTGSADVTLSVPTAAAATNLVGSDVSDNYDATDFQISFDMAADESVISGYRVFVVKSADAAAFDMAAADTNTNGIPIAKTGANISLVLPTTAKDTDGSAITVDTPYKFFVVSLATSGGVDALSAASNEVTLSKPDGINSLIATGKVKAYTTSNGLVIASQDAQVIINSASIINVSGEQVASISINGDHTTTYNTSNMQRGVYIVMINTNKGMAAVKVKI